MRLQGTGGAMPGTTGAAPYPYDTRSAMRAAAGGRGRSVPLKAQFPASASHWYLLGFLHVELLDLDLFCFC